MNRSGHFLILVLAVFAVAVWHSVPANAQPAPAPAVNCSAVNASIDFPAECPPTATAPTPTAPVKAPSFNAAFAPVKTITSVAYGIGYGVLNILLIAALVILIKCFKRKAKPKSKANAGV